MKQLYLILMALAFVSCGNDTNYLYREVLPAAQEYQKQFNIKEAIKHDKVDILWIIDNSGSMGSYQSDVIASTSLFMQQFTQRSNVDWKMGLISTDQGDAPYIGFDRPLDSSIPTGLAIQEFEMAVSRLGTSGDAVERSFGPVLNALNEYDGSVTYTATGSVRKPRFLRSGAYLILIFVSDEVEQTEMTAQEFMDELAVLMGGSLRYVRAYGAIASQDLGCRARDPYYGEKFEEVINATGGSVFPACSPTFGADLAKVGGEIVSQLTRPFLFLEHRPVATTLRVVHEPIDGPAREIPPGVSTTGGMWTYNPDMNAIEFNTLEFAPGEEEFVRVYYDIDDGYIRD